MHFQWSCRETRASVVPVPRFLWQRNLAGRRNGTLGPKIRKKNVEKKIIFRLFFGVFFIIQPVSGLHFDWVNNLEIDIPSISRAYFLRGTLITQMYFTPSLGAPDYNYWQEDQTRSDALRVPYFLVRSLRSSHLGWVSLGTYETKTPRLPVQVSTRFWPSYKKK